MLGKVLLETHYGICGLASCSYLKSAASSEVLSLVQVCWWVGHWSKVPSGRVCCSGHSLLGIGRLHGGLGVLSGVLHHDASGTDLVCGSSEETLEQTLLGRDHR